MCEHVARLVDRVHALCIGFGHSVWVIELAESSAESVVRDRRKAWGDAEELVVGLSDDE